MLLLGVEAAPSWGELVTLVPSLSVWGIVSITVVRVLRWLVERSDGLTRQAIVGLRDDLDRCRERNGTLEERWSAHAEVCPIMHHRSDD